MPRVHSFLSHLGQTARFMGSCLYGQPLPRREQLPVRQYFGQYMMRGVRIRDDDFSTSFFFIDGVVRVNVRAVEEGCGCNEVVVVVRCVVVAVVLVKAGVGWSGAVACCLCRLLDPPLLNTCI